MCLIELVLIRMFTQDLSTASNVSMVSRSPSLMKKLIRPKTIIESTIAECRIKLYTFLTSFIIVAGIKRSKTKLDYALTFRRKLVVTSATSLINARTQLVVFQFLKTTILSFSLFSLFSVNLFFFV